MLSAFLLAKSARTACLGVQALLRHCTDLPKCLSSSSSRCQQDVAAKIEQTHNLTILVHEGSEKLLTTYVRYQGEPFGSADFNPPIQSFEGLPLPPPSTAVWQDLSDAERLQRNATVFSNFPEFLTAAKNQQAGLSPAAKELHHQFDRASVQCLGLASNLQSIMASLDIPPGPAMPVQVPKTDSAFLMKLTGYSICRLYEGWASSCQSDMAALAAKYPVCTGPI
ncbi:cardiotrophin-1 isoform X2 [Varanus komodoensis]|uniref:cardiotrophin-1 isoform X2 n=1 Tax=Varanus komodoensis TaxID=61221 RepID=UPI001CF7D362|nr:cardiotrophin-1 isoform X2 [Varanus komodoensis]